MGPLRTLVEFIGLDDHEGNVSFNKSVTAVAMATFVYAVATNRDPSWPLLSFGVVVVGAGFGIKGFLAAVKQNTTAAQLEHSARMSVDTQLTGDLGDIVRAVKERRSGGDTEVTP